MAYDLFQRELRKVVDEQVFPVEFRASPIAELLTSTIDALDMDAMEARLSFVTDERFLHGGGVVQGGIVAGMLDFTMAVLLLADLDEGYSIGTTNLNVEFLRPAPAGVYVGTARVIRKGRTISFSHADLHDEAGKHIASASATNVIIPMNK
ncbi:MAG: PaaI family thioesterase [Gammaproteobacteria bacterium]|uniref:PaaI family thioesterase n=1 Tax=Pseudomaricurvus alcaniphilus TaxID=1166482 RepID=UPI00140892B5|nr:PaaI family thioesterase [Pseudomaricurvus alcaniphilus]MBR9911085.1 PaaI family thioesterase [Gammaproteobacteria bacterium]NHN36411.1 PaaI family thioesterase [Pseudomaricurvus alcaniphilus]